MQELNESADTKPCPSCGGEILAKALKCRHCGIWIREDTASEAAEAEATFDAPSFDAASYSHRQPVTHLVLLSILSFGLYQLYWFYQSWKNLKEHAGIDVNPGWRTAGLCVPFVNIAMVYHQFRTVRDVAEAAGIGVDYSPRLLTATYFAFVLASNLSLDAWALSLFTVVPLVPVHTTLNRYWERAQRGKRMRVDFTTVEVAVMIFGGILTAMAVSATLMQR